MFVRRGRVSRSGGYKGLGSQTPPGASPFFVVPLWPCEGEVGSTTVEPVWHQSLSRHLRRWGMAVKRRLTLTLYGKMVNRTIVSNLSTPESEGLNHGYGCGCAEMEDAEVQLGED